MNLRERKALGTELGRYMVQERCTVRQVAKTWRMSKTTVHMYLTRYLPGWDAALYKKVRRVLDRNKAERHIRGGAATKKKFAEKK